MDKLRFAFLGRAIYCLFLKLEQSKHCRILKRIPKCGTLLDGGCGNGLHSDGFAEKADWVVGLDNEINEVKIYRKRYGKRGPVVLGSLDRLPFHRYVFDICVLQDSLEHIENPSEVMIQIRNVTKTNGIVIATVPNWYNRFFDANAYSHAAHRQFRTSIGWHRMFKKCGFINCTVSAVNFPLMNLDFLRRRLHLFGIGVMLEAWIQRKLE